MANKLESLRGEKLKKLNVDEMHLIYGGRASKEEETHRSYTSSSENESGCTDEKVSNYNDYKSGDYETEVLASEVVCWTCD